MASIHAAPWLLLLPSILVGLVLLVSAFIKVLDPGRFIEQIKQYRLLGSRRSTYGAAYSVVGFEIALGVALILAFEPGLVLPASALFLAGLGALTLWAAAAGRIDDCGCYGPLLSMSPWQSLGLDIVYIALLALAWSNRPVEVAASGWQALGILLLTAAALGAFRRGLGTPWIDLAPLRRGRHFQKRWLGRPESLPAGERVLVVFLSKTCPYCQKWVPLLNVIEAQAEMPRVVGFLGLDEEDRAAFGVEHGVRFPLEPIAPQRLRALVDVVPTAVMVEEGRIEEVFEGMLPKDYVERIRGFYESVQSRAISPPQERFAG